MYLSEQPATNFQNCVNDTMGVYCANSDIGENLSWSAFAIINEYMELRNLPQ